MSLRAPARAEEARRARRRRQETTRVKERRKPRACREAEAQSFRFSDPYWDEAFNSYYDPTLRTCCRI